MAISSNHEAVKVVLIDTQYIQTDALSFKSVVQSLTGKDSCVAWIEKSSFTGGDAKRKRSAAVRIRSSSGINVVGHSGGDADRDGGNRGTNSNDISFLSKGMSFKDLDRMMRLEMPSKEDLQCWLSEAQNN